MRKSIQTSDMMVPNLNPFIVNISSLYKKLLPNMHKGFYN